MREASMKILRAKYVLPMRGAVIEDGAVAVQDGLIAGVDRYDAVRRMFEGATTDLGEAVLLPGLINAHCHLDYTDMRGQVPWRGDFFDWIRRITALKKQWSENQYRQSIQHGAAMSWADGITTVVNAGGSGVTIEGEPGRVWWCVELIDIEWSEDSLRMAEAAAGWAETHPLSGLAPHAPYTVSGPLYRWLARRAREHGWLLTTHVAESREEFDRFRTGRDGPVRWLDGFGVWGRNCLAAHVNWLTDDEARLLATAGVSVAHCPRTHRFFQRPPAPVELWRRHGLNICLGTDSLASNESLDLFAEMREMARAWPGWSAEDVLCSCTVNCARALGRDGRLGCLTPGADADLIAVRLAGNGADPFESVVYNEQPVLYSMSHGKETHNELG